PMGQSLIRRARVIRIRVLAFAGSQKAIRVIKASSGHAQGERLPLRAPKTSALVERTQAGELDERHLSVGREELPEPLSTVGAILDGELAARGLVLLGAPIRLARRPRGKKPNPDFDDCNCADQPPRALADG